MTEQIVSLNWLGQEISLKTGKMAKQANASIFIECGGTVVLTAATMGKNLEEDPGFFPLSVHFIEKFYAAGRLPGGFFKRESKPSDKSVLTSRIIDRSLRPLFPEGFRNEVQVIPTVLSIGSTSADILGAISSSAALYISDIPFFKPTGSIRVILEEGKLVATHAVSAQMNNDLDLLISATKDGITMIEGISNNISDELMIEALELGFKEIQPIIQLQDELKKLAGKEKMIPLLFLAPKELEEEVGNYVSDEIKQTFSIKEKLLRNKAVDKIFAQVETHFLEKYNDPKIGKKAKEIAYDQEYLLVRDHLFTNDIRVDGRKPDELRHIEAEVGLLPRLHGSALFTRGETQSLGVLTLGSVNDEQRIDDIENGDSSKRYMLHYNFPSFSVGEVGKVGAPGRREIGHGYLAEKSLKAVLPSEKDFPYTIRLVSEILESNGSSSMASVCSGSLALMDGGVPIKEHVAGIAMGLMFNHDKTDYKILTDIQGLEDHYGDIDFKVAGTTKGINAFQLDIKMDAVSINLLKEALKAAYKARLHILEIMNKVISSPKVEMSRFAPKIFSLQVNTDNLRHLIGPGGKTIKALTEEFKSNIDILPTGEVRVISSNVELAEQLIEKINFMVRDIKIGDIIQGRVTKTAPFGAFIELAAGREGLCHISKLSSQRVNAVTDILSEGMVVKVKVIDIDGQGKIAVSLKDV